MNDIVCITGPSSKLKGNVKVSGAKNSTLPLLFATLLTEEECCLNNVPNLEDTLLTKRILSYFGAESELNGNSFKVKCSSVKTTVAPHSLIKSMRASFWLMGPLLARVGKASIPLPGGDLIGTRPVDLHLKGFSQMGAEFRMEHGVVHAEVSGGLRPANVEFPFPSVGATHNLMMAMALTPGKSSIKGAAKEPEVKDLADFLNKMGAKIIGAGTDEIFIEGQEELHGASHTIIGDRIEATTFMLASAMTAGDVLVSGVEPENCSATLDLLEKMGCRIIKSDKSIRVIGPERIKPVSFATGPFPGVATDVQPLFIAALCIADGISEVTEEVFESRFGHVAEYRRFGADIKISGKTVIITGKHELSSAPAEALDIRAAAGLVLIGLIANGTTQVSEVRHLDRGYEGMVEKFRKIGANVSRVPVVDLREISLGC